MNNIAQNKKIIVGMSGGVDSSVAALLLLKQGYEVEGLFMKNWEEDDTDEYCAASEDLKDVKSVCNKLDIKLHTANFSAEYWDNVFEYFLAEYKAGRTPNPDILCNKEIKFKAALDYVKMLDGNYFATGHYAKKIEKDGESFLARAKDLNKDQTYFLYTLGQEQLDKVLFPLADLTKPEIREIAKSEGLITHSKKDSTGICFIGERKFKDFLQKYLPAKPGKIVTTNNEEIGCHDGLMYYTLGQRQGLGIGGTKNTNNEPWYVVDKNLTKNELIVAQGPNHSRLMAKELVAFNLHWVSDNAISNSFNCTAKIRYRQKDEACNVEIQNGKALVKFDSDQKAITPGQSIVFYNEDICLGGGVIESVKRDSYD